MAKPALPPRSAAFTTRFPQRVNVLQSEVGVSEAYHPSPGSIQPPVTKFNAIWDTGASGSVINQRVISALKLEPTDETDVHTANGKRKAGVYLVNIYLPNKVAIPGIRVTEGEILGDAILIGMDIIGLGDFSITHPGGKTCMSFHVPPSRNIDFVEEINATRENLQVSFLRLVETTPARAVVARNTRNAAADNRI